MDAARPSTPGKSVGRGLSGKGTAGRIPSGLDVGYPGICGPGEGLVGLQQAFVAAAYAPQPDAG